jgi:hypothetical protein
LFGFVEYFRDMNEMSKLITAIENYNNFEEHIHAGCKAILVSSQITPFISLPQEPQIQYTNFICHKRNQ